MDLSNLTSLPEESEEEQPHEPPRDKPMVSAFASRPDRPPTQWVIYPVVLNSIEKFSNPFVCLTSFADKLVFCSIYLFIVTSIVSC